MSRKINNTHTRWKEGSNLSQFAEDFIVYVENSKKSTKNPPKTKKQLQQGCRIQDYAQKNTFLYSKLK